MYIGYIYIILDQLTNKCYIGQHYCRTIKDGYFCSGIIINKIIKKRGRTFLKKRILGFIKEPSLQKLQMQLNEAEKECIEFFHSFGSDNQMCNTIYGYNLTKGGDGLIGFKMSKESIEKSASKKRGIPRSLETKKKLSAANIGKSSWHKGIKCSEETKEKLKKINTGKKQSEETIQKRINTVKNSSKKRKPISIEGRKNMSVAHIGKKLSEGAKEKVSAFQKGRPKSDIQKLKTSLSLKQYYENKKVAS